MGNKRKEERSHGSYLTFFWPVCVVLRWTHLGSQDVGCGSGDADAAERTGQADELGQHCALKGPPQEVQEKKLSSHSSVLAAQHRKQRHSNAALFHGDFPPTNVARNVFPGRPDASLHKSTSGRYQRVPAKVPGQQQQN